MELCYIYDESFDGLLTALFEARYAQFKPDKICGTDEYENDLFSEKKYIKSDRQCALKAINLISNEISIDAMHNIFYAFLASSDSHGKIIYDYFKLGLEKKRRIDRFLHDERVIAVHALRDKLLIERHRLFGLIRFQKVENGFYYAKIEPDNNVVGLLAPHFSKRLANERWMIHDISRNLAAINEPVGKWSVVEASLDREPELDCEEPIYQNLWRTFFKNIAIENRTNPKLQKRFVPQRYWKHIVEMQ